MKTPKLFFDTENLLANSEVMKNRKSQLFCWLFIIFFLLATVVIIFVSLFWFNSPVIDSDFDRIHKNETESESKITKNQENERKTGENPKNASKIDKNYSQSEISENPQKISLEAPSNFEEFDYDYLNLLDDTLKSKNEENSFQNHPNYKKFAPIEPYFYKKSRVQNGEVAGLKEFPWFVALFHQNPKNASDLRPFCGGSLIADDLVLTAAHCFKHKM